VVGQARTRRGEKDTDTSEPAKGVGEKGEKGERPRGRVEIQQSPPQGRSHPPKEKRKIGENEKETRGSSPIKFDTNTMRRLGSQTQGENKVV